MTASKFLKNLTTVLEIIGSDINQKISENFENIKIKLNFETKNIKSVRNSKNLWFDKINFNRLNNIIQNNYNPYHLKSLEKKLKNVYNNIYKIFLELSDEEKKFLDKNYQIKKEFHKIENSINLTKKRFQYLKNNIENKVILANGKMIQLKPLHNLKTVEEDLKNFEYNLKIIENLEKEVINQYKESMKKLNETEINDNKMLSNEKSKLRHNFIVNINKIKLARDYNIETISPQLKIKKNYLNIKLNKFIDFNNKYTSTFEFTKYINNLFKNYTTETLNEAEELLWTIKRTKEILKKQIEFDKKYKSNNSFNTKNEIKLNILKKFEIILENKLELENKNLITDKKIKTYIMNLKKNLLEKFESQNSNPVTKTVQEDKNEIVVGLKY